MHAPKSEIDVEQLKERIRSQVQVNQRRIRNGHTGTGLPRLALDRDKAVSDVLQFHLNDGSHSHLQKLESLRAQARAIPSAVELTLRGSREALARVEADDIVAYIDLAGLGPGQYSLTVHADSSPDAGVTRIEPSVVQVQITSGK